MLASLPIRYLRTLTVLSGFVAVSALSSVPVLGTRVLAAQTTGATPPPPGAPTVPIAAGDSVHSGAVRVFLDCQSTRCDFDFMRDQIRWIDWVRDRLFADVQLLVTSLRTGAGGTEYTISAIGLQRYRGRADTVVLFVEPNETEDVARRKLARSFSLLAAPYAAHTSLADRLTISYTPPAAGAGAAAAARAINDPWNYWVYRVGANGFTNGEKRSRVRHVNLNTSANRITEAWRIGLNANLGYDESRFDIGSGKLFVNLQRNYGGNLLIVKSLGPHLSAGIAANAGYSDFFNYRLTSRLAPAIEYNFFPYRDFTRRQLTAYYAIGVASYRYKDTTIFGRIAETRPVHNATLSWTARQPWGNVNANLYGNQYLHDLNRFNYGVSGNMSVRITRGLSVNFGGNFSRVADQLYLSKGNLGETEVVARQRALGTNFRYNGNFGVSYTFGSIYNTLVNPRFGASRGGDF